MQDSASSSVRVLHFVTGGFSGATQVAIDLVRASQSGTTIEPLLVLRRKRQTPRERVASLQAEGVPIETVTGLAHALTIWQLARICRHFQPDVLVAHGFPEHIMGRYAGLLAGVPALIQVEHNSRERYGWSKLIQARWLARRTAHIVGVSDGVKRSLLARGFPPERVLSIPNGIELGRFDATELQPYAERAPHVVMCARFSSQKDHATAIEALALLNQAGHHTRLLLAGGGKTKYRQRAESLARRLGVAEQVDFLGMCSDVPALLMRHQVCLLSTHYEGMPLALIEGMAAGCAVVASDVIGVSEVISHENNGLLVPHLSPQALADALLRVLTDPGLGARLARTARQDAQTRHGVALMRQRYEALLTTANKARTSHA